MRKTGPKLLIAILAAAAGLLAACHGLKKPEAEIVVDHGRLDSLLRRFVDRDGMVNYPGLARHRDALIAYIASVSRIQVDQLSPDEMKAFWINIHNAASLKRTLDHYPIDSVGRIQDFRTSPAFMISDLPLSLDMIANQALLGFFGDPRTLFVLNFSTRSGPAVPDRALSGSTVNRALDQAVERFLADPGRNRYDPDTRTLLLAPVFQQYAGVIAELAGSVPDFIEPFLPPEPGAWVRSGDYRIEYLDRDPALNRSEPRR